MEATLTAVAEAMPMAYLVLDSEQRVLRCGGRSAPVLGISPESAIGKPIDALLGAYDCIGEGVGGTLSGAFRTAAASIDGHDFEFKFLPASDKSPFVTVVATEVFKQALGKAHNDPLAGVLDEISDGLVVLNGDGRIQSANRSALEIFGYSSEELIGRNLRMLLPEFNAKKSKPSIKTAVTGRRRDGSTVEIAVSLRSLDGDGDGGPRQLATIVNNSAKITAPSGEDEARYALAALGANDGLWDWNLEDGTIYLSPRWRSMLGLENETLQNSPDEWLGRIHPDDLAAFCKAFDSHIEGKSGQFEHEYRMRHADGEFRWMQVRGLVVREAKGKAYRMAGSQSEITDRKLAEERLLHGALHDSLTGLPNRALMMDRIGQALARMEGSGELSFALVILDLDRFMVVNENLGHGAGDDLLVSLSRRLEGKLGPGDTLARLGGDEFAILMEGHKDVEAVKKFVKNLQKIIAQPFELIGKEIFIAASVGIVFSAPRYIRANDMLRDADLAMYRAKKEGKSSIEVFEERRHRPRFDQLQVETSLRYALDKGWIHVFYQPIVDLQSRRIVGFEALSRLIHPSQGIIPPASFIGIAEETGLIVPLGEQVLKMACAKTVEWQRQYGLGADLTISVNFSARHLAEENIVALLADVLADTGLPAKSLKIEITETLITSNPELASQTLDRIKKLGITLSLDDFGTGYSSLGYLRRFPIDTLKMDRSFVGRMDTDTRDLELVRMIIQLAHTLGMEVVSEGIETKSQLDILGALNCKFGQGFYFSRPLPADEAAQLLAHPPAWR